MVPEFFAFVVVGGIGGDDEEFVESGFVRGEGLVGVERAVEGSGAAEAFEELLGGVFGEGLVDRILAGEVTVEAGGTDAGEFGEAAHGQGIETFGFKEDEGRFQNFIARGFGKGRHR